MFILGTRAGSHWIVHLAGKIVAQILIRIYGIRCERVTDMSIVHQGRRPFWSFDKKILGKMERI